MRGVVLVRLSWRFLRCVLDAMDFAFVAGCEVAVRFLVGSQAADLPLSGRAESRRARAATSVHRRLAFV
jgi:hypothetical protein